VIMHRELALSGPPSEAVQLPQNVEAEQAVLGSILLNRDAIIPIAAWLKVEHFYLAKHGQIYQAMLDLYARRIPPDTQTVTDELRRHSMLEAVGGVLFLSALTDQVPTSYHVEHYARIVERTGVLRLLITAGGAIAALGFQEDVELEETLGRAEQLVHDITQRRVTRDFAPLGEVFHGLFDQITAAHEHGCETTGVPTGLTNLDMLLGGLQPSDLLVLAGRPGTGKSACALSMAHMIASEARKVVGVFSLEMSREQLGQRLLALETGIDTHRLRSGALHHDELERAVAAMGRLSTLPVHIEDSAGVMLAELRSKARRLQAWQGLDVLIVDYLQLVRARGSDRYQEVSEVARGLKNLAKDLNVPIIALSQLSRAVEGRASKVPQLSDLRESGEIEQAADVVVFIYREELYEPATERKGLAELHVAKHRNGPLGVVPVRFDARTTRFQNLAYWAVGA
jgi:replicative DNA helicase